MSGYILSILAAVITGVLGLRYGHKYTRSVSLKHKKQRRESQLEWVTRVRENPHHKALLKIVSATFDTVFIPVHNTRLVDLLILLIQKQDEEFKQISFASEDSKEDQMAILNQALTTAFAKGSPDFWEWYSTKTKGLATDRPEEFLLWLPPAEAEYLRQVAQSPPRETGKGTLAARGHTRHQP